MDLMGKITAAIDAAKRTAGKRVSDLTQNPGQFLEMSNDQAANYNANVQPTIRGGELTNRPLTPEEIDQKSTDLAMAVMPMGVGSLKVIGPQSGALRLAQQRAALPAEKGGLGLSAENTAAERAAAMGFNTSVYRGDRGDVSRLTPKRAPKNEQMALSSIHVAETPEFASRYATKNGESVMPLVMRGDNTVDASRLVNVPSPEYGQLKALLPRGQKPYTSRGGMGRPEDPLLSPPLQGAIDVAGAGKAEKVFSGKDAIKYDAKYGSVSGDGRGMYVDERSPAFAVLNPDVLRSRFAAFDPWRKTAAIAAAMGVAAPDLLAAENDQIIETIKSRR